MIPSARPLEIADREHSGWCRRVASTYFKLFSIFSSMKAGVAECFLEYLQMCSAVDMLLLFAQVPQSGFWLPNSLQMDYRAVHGSTYFLGFRPRGSREQAAGNCLGTSEALNEAMQNHS